MNPSSLKDQRRAGARRIRWVAVTAGVLAVVVASVAIASQSADGPDATSSASVKKQVKKLDKKVKKLNKKLKKVDKEEGPAGQDGTAGADGLGAIMGHTQANAGDTTFAPLNGGSASLMESKVQILSPNREITLSEFGASGDPVGPGGLTVTVRVNGVDTAITCVIASGTTCSSTASVTVPPRSKLALETDNQGAGDIELGWSMTAS